MDAPPADRRDHRGPLPGLERGHDCWAQVVADYEQAVAPIRRDARRFRLPAADVDDAIQDALYQAWLKREEHDGTRPLVPWLRGFGRRAIRARLMARSLMDVSDGTGAASLVGRREPSPDECAELTEDRDRVRVLVARAPSRYRDVLLARYWAGMRLAEVADRLGGSTRAVEGRMERALGWIEHQWTRAENPRLWSEQPRENPGIRKGFSSAAWKRMNDGASHSWPPSRTASRQPRP